MIDLGSIIKQVKYNWFAGEYGEEFSVYELDTDGVQSIVFCGDHCSVTKDGKEILVYNLNAVFEL